MLQFELPTLKRKEEAIRYIKEFHLYKSAINGTGGLDINDYESWLEKVNLSHFGTPSSKDRVPASTYFVIVDDKVVGMVNIRHELNNYLVSSGSGHIGYSVRPTERRKGYATEILRQALVILKNNYGVQRALVGCYKDNIGSKKTILNCGGYLKEIIDEDEKNTLAYYIDL